MGPVAWGIFRGSDAARVFVWLFTGLALVSLAVRVTSLVEGGTGWPLAVGDLATVTAAGLVARPAARDFFLARRQQGQRRRSAGVEYLDD